MTNYADDDQQPLNYNSSSVSRIKKERYYEAARELESRGAEFNTELELRQQGGAEIRQRQLALLDTREKEYSDERAQVKQKIDEAKLELEATHRSAVEHCSEIPLRYVPGKTTEEDVLKVPVLHEAEAAKSLGLPFGVGFNDKLVKFFKPILTLLCWLMASLSLGLGFRLLEAKNICLNLVNVCISLIMGGVVAIGILTAVTWIWKALGTKIGSGRPANEVLQFLFPVALITTLLLLGMAFLDAKALTLLNAARAALNPAFALPMEVAMLIGVVISGTYVLGLAGAAFADGYNVAANRSIDAVIKNDENHKRDAVKQKIYVKDALGALGYVKTAEEFIRNLEAELKRMDQEFKQERAEMMKLLPEIPACLETNEKEELSNLRDRVRSQKAHFDAQQMSQRGSVSHDKTS